MSYMRSYRPVQSSATHYIFMNTINTSKCYSVGRANSAACSIAQHSFYNFTLFSTLTFERSYWADI